MAFLFNFPESNFLNRHFTVFGSHTLLGKHSKLALGGGDETPYGPGCGGAELLGPAGCSPVTLEEYRGSCGVTKLFGWCTSFGSHTLCFENYCGTYVRSHFVWNMSISNYLQLRVSNYYLELGRHQLWSQTAHSQFFCRNLISTRRGRAQVRQYGRRELGTISTHCCDVPVETHCALETNLANSY